MTTIEQKLLQASFEFLYWFSRFEYFHHQTPFSFHHQTPFSFIDIGTHDSVY